MGLRSPFRSSSSCRLPPPRKPTPPPSKKLPNPDPSNFVIIATQQVDKHLVARVHYPDCTNYEGVKILVFLNTKLKELAVQEKLDPHFCDDDHLSPFARFEPTMDGWRAAIRLCEVLL